MIEPIAIAFTAYNRPQYLSEVVQAWLSVLSSTTIQADFHFFVEPSDKLEQVIGIANALTDKSRIQVNLVRLGVLSNPYAALSNVFQYYDKAVLWEDDVIPSTDVLEYFQFGFEKMTFDHLGICAFSSHRVPVSQDEFLVESRSKFDPLGWGTTKENWNKYISHSWFLNAMGNPDGSETGWDWGMSRLTKALGMQWLTPSQSRSDHIGVYGTHMGPDIYHTRRGVSFSHYRDKGNFKIYYG